jgi:hypothetical protein
MVQIKRTVSIVMPLAAAALTLAAPARAQDTNVYVAPSPSTPPASTTTSTTTTSAAPVYTAPTPAPAVVQDTPVYVAPAPVTVSAESSTYEHVMPAPMNALELKAGTGYTQGFGMLLPGQAVINNARAGIGVDAEIDHRITPHWSTGIQGEYQEFDPINNQAARGFAGNVGFTVHGSPYQVGDPWFRLGFGYRMLWLLNPLNQPNVDQTMVHGFQLAKATLGYDFRLSPGVALAPEIGADVNLFLWKDQNGSNTALSNPQVGSFIFAGMQARFDVGPTVRPGAVVTTASR